MTVSGKGEVNNGNGPEMVDLGSITKTSSTYLNEACTVYSLPFSSQYQYRLVSAWHMENLNSGHEYNLKFSWNSGIPSSCLFGCYLVFTNASGEVLREQELYSSSSSSSGWNRVDIDFKPDTSGLGGYKTSLEFRYMVITNSAINLRISEIVEFTDKDDNSSWFEKIWQAIKDVPGSIVDSIRSLPERLRSLFDSLGEKFDNAKNAIGEWFTELGDKITGKFVEISDKFSETFDKFKPRVYQSLNWVIGYINPNNGEYGQSNNNACVTEYFLVSDTSYYIEFVDPNHDFNFFSVHQYDLSKNYIKAFNVAPGNVFELDSGYYYRFRLYKGSDLRPHGDGLSDYCNEYVLLYADEGWLSAFGHYILNGLKSLFIPADGYFDAYMEKTKIWASDHFGFLYTCSDLFISTISSIRDMLSDDYVFILPAAEFDLNGQHYVLWNEYTVPMGEYLQNKIVKFMYESYCVLVGSICAFGLFGYARKVYNKTLAN